MASNKDLLFKMYRYGINHLTHNESLMLMKIVSHIEDYPHTLKYYIEEKDILSIVTSGNVDARIIISSSFKPHLFECCDERIVTQDIDKIYELVKKHFKINYKHLKDKSC